LYFDFLFGMKTQMFRTFSWIKRQPRTPKPDEKDQEAMIPELPEENPKKIKPIQKDTNPTS
jgi:hypothetical protein